MNALIDYDELFLQLLTRDVTDAGMVSPEYLVDTVDNLPAVIYDTAMTGQVSNGPGLWTGTLTVTVTGDPGSAWAAFQQVYAGVHSWAPPPSGNGTGRVDGVGAVESVTDVSLLRPEAGGSPPGGKGSQQYSGTWTVLLRTVEGDPHAGT